MKSKRDRKKKQKWIDVQDHLPDIQREVQVLRKFVFLGAPAQAVAYRTSACWHEANSGLVLDDVVCWRPVPKPPKVSA